jgi:hypothetical protein
MGDKARIIKLVKGDYKFGRLRDFFRFVTLFGKYKWELPKENNVTEGSIDVDKWALTVNNVAI